MEVDGRFVIPNRGETSAGRLRWEWVWKGSENGASVVRTAGSEYQRSLRALRVEHPPKGMNPMWLRFKGTLLNVQVRASAGFGFYRAFADHSPSSKRQSWAHLTGNPRSVGRAGGKAKGGSIALRRPQNQQHGRAGHQGRAGQSRQSARWTEGVRDVRIREERQRRSVCGVNPLPFPDQIRLRSPAHPVNRLTMAMTLAPRGNE